MVINISERTNFAAAVASPKVAEVARRQGDAMALKLILVVLKQFCDSYNLGEGKNMTFLQLVECSKAYAEKYPNNSVKDLVLCLKRAKNGAYGQIFGRIDQSVIFEFLAKYEQERAEFLEEQHVKTKQAEFNNQMAVLANLPAETRELLKNIGKKDQVEQAYRTDLLPPMDRYLQEVKLLLPTATPEELAAFRSEAINRNFVALIELIDTFQLTVNSNS